MSKPKLMIVDDDEDIRTQMRWALHDQYQVILAGDRADALASFRNEHPPVTILDLGLPPRPNGVDEGMHTLTTLLSLDRSAKVIILSGQGEKENAIRAVGAGAYDFFCKPVEVDKLKILLQRCFEVADLEREYRELQKQSAADNFEGMLGTSPQMQSIFATIRKVATTHAPVLILGESGTGKEMVARALHQKSPRADGPFVAINCNAIPENLLESELFGHEKGSFTGAHQQSKGILETAHGGTLFLDEIGELPPAIQTKLLRFLQEHTFQRVGGREELESDARVVAATNAGLKEQIRSGQFREDLYFRLAVIVISLPPLRQRGEDVALLACEFLRRFGAQNGKKGLTLSPDGLQAIAHHRWPGNVRELQNCIQRAVIMADGRRLNHLDLELPAPENESPPTLREAREQVERELVQQSLRKHSGRISAAAADLGISRPTFYELMDKLKIVRNSVRN